MLDVYSYIIEMKDVRTSGSQWQQVVTNIETTSHKVTGYKNDTDYLVRVLAANESGFSNPSVSVTFHKGM